MLKRDKYCTEVSEKDVDNEIIVCGWVNSWRDHGGVIFIDLRDNTGLLQVVFKPEVSKECHEIANKLRSEDVIAVKGIVEKRLEEMINPKLMTGTIEIRLTTPPAIKAGVNLLGVSGDCSIHTPLSLIIKIRKFK